MLLLMRWCCWCADADAAADALMLLMRWCRCCCWCADAADALIPWCCWCADAADALMLLMHWCYWTRIRTCSRTFLKQFALVPNLFGPKLYFWVLFYFTDKLVRLLNLDSLSICLKSDKLALLLNPPWLAAAAGGDSLSTPQLRRVIVNKDAISRHTSVAYSWTKQRHLPHLVDFYSPPLKMVFWSNRQVNSRTWILKHEFCLEGKNVLYML